MLTTSIARGKTGTAPGTTVLTIPSGGSLGAIPSDFDVSRAHLNYQRFYHGWVSGDLSGTDDVLPWSHEAALAELEVHRARLAAEKEIEEIKHTRTSRIWMVVGGLVGVATLAVSVFALKGR